MRINYDFGDLEAFLTVKDCGSFHLAGERLNLSQSAVTRRVQKLEEALGTELFHRSTRSVKPTLAAKRLEARARAMLEDAFETSQAMRDESVAFEHQRSTVVTVAIIPTIAARILAPAITEFRGHGSNARVQIKDGSANDVAEWVAQGEADFGICSLPLLEANTDFEVLFEEEIGVVLNPSHPLARQTNLSWRDIADQELILPARGTGNRLLIDEARARAEASLVWTYETGRSTTALDLAASQLGLALLPKSVMASANGRELTFRDLRDPQIKRPIGVLTRFGLTETRTVSALKDTIRQSVADQLA
ncbi:MAG: LysR family transcriptional regulator [Cognatishimia sp.]|uniref:LysR family transcriptional regulator n=1 Tax=Cognatishimia sp. TaxID=2211648 RepID=UPI003B8AEC1E